MFDNHASLRLLQHAPALIWRSGTDAKCYWFNETWLAFRGRTMEQEAGDGWTEGVHPDEFDGCLRIYMDAFEHRCRFEMEYRILDINGNYRWILDHGIPSLDDDGTFDGYVGYCFDITDRKIIEQSLNERKDELERSIVELKQARAELERLALFDKLTGLPNRHSLLKSFESLSEQRATSACPLSILVVDADHFKAINDLYGHLVGDDCLVILSSLILENIRSTDIASRFGGEEFVILLPGTDADDALDVATKLCRGVSRGFPSASAYGIEMTVSVGCATDNRGAFTDFKTLMARADSALYEAKNSGRNRVSVANLLAAA